METLVGMTFSMTSSIVIMSSSDYGPDSIKNKNVKSSCENEYITIILNKYAVIYCLETKYFW